MSSTQPNGETAVVSTAPPPLIHYTMPPYTHGECGTPLSRVGTFRGEPVSCVVCLDLAEGER